jgi:hypothetical protein
VVSRIRPHGAWVAHRLMTERAQASSSHAAEPVRSTGDHDAQAQSWLLVGVMIMKPYHGGAAGQR